MCDLGMTYTRGLIRFSNCAGPTRLSLSHPYKECLDPNLPTECMAKTGQTGLVPRLIRVFAACTLVSAQIRT